MEAPKKSRFVIAEIIAPELLPITRKRGTFI